MHRLRQRTQQCNSLPMKEYDVLKTFHSSSKFFPWLMFDKLYIFTTSRQKYYEMMALGFQHIIFE